MTLRAKPKSTPVARRAVRPAKASPVTGPMRIKIFISYASEDSELVTSIVALLKDTFRFAPLDFFRDVEQIKLGQNFALQIDKALDESDILLVIFTERMKMSHSYTGYEVGYFNLSIKQRPKGRYGLDRIYVPFCIGADIPDTMHFIQGVSIGANDVYKVLKTKIDNSPAPIGVDHDHPIFKLLERLADIVLQIMGSDDDFDRCSQSAKLASSAAVLYRIVHEYLQGRISSETYPERKLTIRTATKPEIGRHGSELTDATVELVGDFFDIFNISMANSNSRRFTWAEFCEVIPLELRINCLSGIQQLATTVPNGVGDNYHIVTTVKRDKSFRLFVSKVVTYVSQKTDIDIYVVKIVSKEYGDPQTTRLLKAISVGLRFRFLVLEDKSEFRPDKLGHPIISLPQLKAKISEMLGQMDLILAEAIDADLYDPELLILIWGEGQEGKVQDMMDTWEKSRQELYSAANEILSGANDSDIKRKKERFVESLSVFCKNIEQMNREFTSRVLSLITDLVQRRIGMGRTGTPPQSAG